MTTDTYIDPAWELLAEVDDSEAYEVDITAIYRRADGMFILATASGCSCWSGEYDIEEYADLDSIEASFRSEKADERRWVTTFAGADDLMKQARSASGSAVGDGQSRPS